MNWIKNTILLLVSLTFCYGLVVVSDWYLEKNIAKKSKIINKNAKKIEKLLADKNIKTKINLKNDGYRSIVWPSLWDDLYSEIDSLNSTYPPLIAGLPLTKTYYCDEGEGFKKYMSDRFGFRNDDESWDKRIKTIFIGDSFTHGACVDNSNTISNKYQEFSKKNSVNLGFSGNNSSHYLTYAKLFIPKIKPDEVFLVFYANDFKEDKKSIIEKVYIDNNADFFSQNRLGIINEKKYFEVAEQIFLEKKKQKLNDRKKNLVIKKVEKKPNHFVYKIIKNLNNHSSLPFIRYLILRNKIIFKPVKRTVLETIKLCKNFSCQLHIVYIPNSKFWRPDTSADSNADKLKRFANKNNVLFFDGRKVINREKGSDDYAVAGPHLSSLGYFKIAELIYNNQ